MNRFRFRIISPADIIFSCSFGTPCSIDQWVLLHWYYFPDSHDSWVNTDIPIELDLPEIPPSYNNDAVWKVSHIIKKFTFYQFLFCERIIFLATDFS